MKSNVRDIHIEYPVNIYEYYRKESRENYKNNYGLMENKTIFKNPRTVKQTVD